MFTNNYINKLVSYADRVYTYDYRSMRREGAKNFDFYAFNRENNTRVIIDKTSCGIYISIVKDEKDVIRKFAKTYSELTNFKKMLQLLG